VTDSTLSQPSIFGLEGIDGVLGGVVGEEGLDRDLVLDVAHHVADEGGQPSTNAR
jgi:hypothetical protein